MTGEEAGAIAQHEVCARVTMPEVSLVHQLSPQEAGVVNNQGSLHQAVDTNHVIEIMSSHTAHLTAMDAVNVIQGGNKIANSLYRTILMQTEMQ